MLCLRADALLTGMKQRHVSSWHIQSYLNLRKGKKPQFQSGQWKRDYNRESRWTFILQASTVILRRRWWSTASIILFKACFYVPYQGKVDGKIRLLFWWVGVTGEEVSIKPLISPVTAADGTINKFQYYVTIWNYVWQKGSNYSWCLRHVGPERCYDTGRMRF